MVMLFEAKSLFSVASSFVQLAQSNEGQFLRPSQIWSSIEGIEDSLVEPHKGFPKILKDPRTRLKKLESVLSLLRSLTASLEEEIAAEKAQIVAATRLCGINKLPNEVLTIIMEYVVSKYSDIMSLSRVCCRFRGLAFSSPRLWASCKLISSASMREIHAITSMSRGKPLIASLRANFFHGSNSTVTEKILSYRSLFKELHVTASDEGTQPHILNGMQLPLLRNLDLELICTDFDPSSPRFYESWDMPQLRCLKTNFVPSRFLGKSITSFDFSLTSDSDVVNFTIDGLSEFLNDCPVLEHLGVRFMFPDLRIYHEVGNPVVLRSLRSLSLQASQAGALALLGQFLERLVADQVTNLSLKLDELSQDFRRASSAKRQEEYEEIEEWGPVILKRISEFPRLRDVQLLIEEGKSNHSKFEAIWNFNSLLCKLPMTLETFSSVNPLHRLYLCWRRRSTRDEPPALSHFQIYNGKDVSMRHVLQLRDWALRGGSGPEIIRVGDCPLIQEDELRSHFSGCNIDYY